MTTNTEALLRRAYHLAEGDVLDVQGFIDLFAEDGVFNGIGGVSGQESYRGEQLGDVVVWMAKMLSDVDGELHRVTCSETSSRSSCRSRAPSSGRSRRPPA
jgi:hypothetical protein